MAQDLDFFLQKFIRYGSALRIFFHKNFFSMDQDLDFFRKNLFTMVQDLDFFPQKFIRYGSLAQDLDFFLQNFQVSVNNVECKKHQYPIQKALRAVKKPAPSKYNEPPKHLNNLKCAPLNKINLQSPC